MRITALREELLKPLGFVAGVVERRQTLPILGNILLRLEGGLLTLTGTDLEVEVVARMQADGDSGMITVPARKLLDICRALPAEAAIEIKSEGDKAIIKASRSRFSLLTLPPSDFPNIETTQWEQSFVLAQQDLKTLLEKTHFCMAQQDVRYYLNGLLLELSGPRLRAIATDGHRLALCETTVKTELSGMRQVIVPRKGVLEIMRFLDSSGEPVEVRLSTNHLRATFGDITFTSKLIDGRFPDYNKVVPPSHSKTVLAERHALRETLSRAAILSNEKYRGVRLSLAENLLQVTAHNPDQEEAQEEIPVQYKGEALEIGFNVTYLIDAIGGLDGAEVQLGLNDPNSSCTIQLPKERQQVYVVMPMRL